MIALEGKRLDRSVGRNDEKHMYKVKLEVLMEPTIMI
jgi:hypothetical protein